MELEKYVDDAIQYVKEHHKWSQGQAEVAQFFMDETGRGIEWASHNIAEEIRSLMNDFSEKKHLPDDWWLDWVDEDGIFLCVES